jgi:parvulin-like peptidyl-prolyl isomerase
VSQLVFNRIRVELIEEEVRRLNLTVTPQQRQQAEQSVVQDTGDQSLFDSLAANYKNYLITRQAELSAVLAARDTPEAELAYYNSHKSQYTQTCVRHILVPTQQQAQSVHDRIAGGADFATVAKNESIDNQGDGGSAAKGGDLGCFSDDDLSQFIAPFRDAVRGLAVDQLSEPVQSQYGFHIIEVTSRTQKSFDDAKSDVSKQLTSATSFFTEQLNKAKIKVNPRYGDYHPADASSGQDATLTPHTPVTLKDPDSSTTQDPNAGLVPTSPDQSGGAVTPDQSGAAGQPDQSGQGGAATPVPQSS